MQVSEGVGWIPTDDFGVVDRLEGEAVVTSFYRLLIPLWPEYSAYVIRQPDGSEQRIRIPLLARSVALGYLRATTWLAALALGVLAAADPARGRAPIVGAVGCAVLAAVLTFAVGRLDEPEQLRRARLRRVVGFGAPPELLAPALRAEVRAHLETTWRARSPAVSWSDAISRGDPAELLVALAEYHQDAALVARAHANLANRVWN